ncbi:RN183 ligase, partial [Atractosteus spatula]|nr:RN183 ligase [Atractosteus spatula]
MAEEPPPPQLDCAICWSPFDNAFRTPKLLVCHHAFCLECLARLSLAMDPEPQGGLSCPLCRRLTPLHDRQSIADLPTDHTLLDRLRLEARPVALEDRRLWYQAAPPRSWLRRSRPTVYTLSLDVERRLRAGQNQVGPGEDALVPESEEEEEGCWFSPQFRVFTYLTSGIFGILLLLLLCFLWARRDLWVAP